MFPRSHPSTVAPRRWPNVHHRKKEALTIENWFPDTRGSKWKPFWFWDQKRGEREGYIMVSDARDWVYPYPLLGSYVKVGEDEPWLAWLSGLNASLRTKGLLVRFPVRTQTWVVGQVPGSGHRRGNHTLIFLSLSFSHLSTVSKNKYRKSFFLNDER